MAGGPEPKDEPQSGDRSPRVLVVDDEIHIRATLHAILKRAGFEVVTAKDGEEAVRTAREWRPDLVLSDVVMPRMDGVTASLQILDSLPDCKVVLLSGHAVVRDLWETARERGYELDVVLKPIHPVELIEHLRMILRDE